MKETEFPEKLIVAAAEDRFRTNPCGGGDVSKELAYRFSISDIAGQE